MFLPLAVPAKPLARVTTPATAAVAVTPEIWFSLDPLPAQATIAIASKPKSIVAVSSTQLSIV